MNVIKRIKQIKHVLNGYVFKWKTDLTSFNRIPSLKSKNDEYSGTKTIVSLTSYGRRVQKNIVYYTLISLLKQTILPDKIILWLDRDNWNEDILPIKLKRLKEKGVEIRFCEDIKSYTKLIPALKEFPESNIITVDDDVIYKKNIIESLIKVHIKNPKKIICRIAKFPISIDHNSFMTYNKWIPPYTLPLHYDYIMPLGVSGVLYPPGTLFKDVTNYNLAKELSPLADDLWFWIMAKINKTNHIVIGQTEDVGCSFDDLYQFFHKGSALTHSNSKENKNDIQLKALMDYYNLTPEDLKNK